MHGILDRAHAVLLDAPIVPGEEHRPFCKGHEDRFVHPELHGELDLTAGRIEANGIDILRQAPQQRGMRRRLEPRRLEVRRQPHLQHVDFLVGRAECLRIRAAQRHQRRIEGVPDRRVGVAVP